MVRIITYCGVWLILFVWGAGLGLAYSDISGNYSYRADIEELLAAGILKDGAKFRPHDTITRAELVSLALRAAVNNADLVEALRNNCYKDVRINDWYAPAMCYAKEFNYLGAGAKGYPQRTVTWPEGVTIVGRVFNVPRAEDRSSWWAPYAVTMGSGGYLPPTWNYTEQELTRGQAAHLINGLRQNKGVNPVCLPDTIKPGACRYLAKRLPENIDWERVTSTWLEWYNGSRALAGLAPYTYDLALEKTSFVWSNRAARLGSITHKRDGQKAYYDYKRIARWFSDQGLSFANIRNRTFVENIGWGYYRCGSVDCTDELLASIRTTYEFFMSEKNKKNRVHYESIMSPTYRQIGLGVALDPSRSRYYLTVHYATEVTADRYPVCAE